MRQGAVRCLRPLSPVCECSVACTACTACTARTAQQPAQCRQATLEAIHCIEKLSSTFIYLIVMLMRALTGRFFELIPAVDSKLTLCAAGRVLFLALGCGGRCGRVSVGASLGDADRA
eukprot:8762912-Pyramimonas_sp.AAC.1